MGHKCYISFNAEDEHYRSRIVDELDIDIVEKSLNTVIDSEDEEEVLIRIREEYLADSTVTIYLIGRHSSGNNQHEEQEFIKRELQASLYHGEKYHRSGILGVVLPTVYEKILMGPYKCPRCEKPHLEANINETTTIKEFSYNYYLPNHGSMHNEDDRYCVLTSWDRFWGNAHEYIQKAFDKRNHPIAAEVRIYP